METLLCGKGIIYEELSTIGIRCNKNKKLTKESVKGKIVVLSAYPYTITKDLISSAHTIINLHTSNLPFYRGRHPVVWAMLKGENKIGITVHQITNEHIDTGDIVLQDYININDNDTYAEVINKLKNKAKRIVKTALQQINYDCVYYRQQPLGTYYPRRKPEDSKLDVSKDLHSVSRFINALSDPMPNAFIEVDGKKITFQNAIYRGDKITVDMVVNG